MKRQSLNLTCDMLLALLRHCGVRVGREQRNPQTSEWEPVYFDIPDDAQIVTIEQRSMSRVISITLISEAFEDVHDSFPLGGTLVFPEPTHPMAAFWEEIRYK